jgi:hypothetical protein
MWRKYQTPDNKERLEWAHAVPKLDLIGTSRLDPLVVEKVVAALGFAGERQFDRDVFSKFPRQSKTSPTSLPGPVSRAARGNLR